MPQNRMALICWWLVLWSPGTGKADSGSVAEWAITSAQNPSRAGPRCDEKLLPIKSIVLATDLSEQGAGRAQYATPWRRIQRQLTVIHVLSPAGTAGACPGRAEHQQETHRLRAQRLWRMVHPEIWGNRPAISPRQMLQSAKESKANLIVLGARQTACGESYAEDQTIRDHSAVGALPGTASAGALLLTIGDPP